MYVGIAPCLRSNLYLVDLESFSVFGYNLWTGKKKLESRHVLDPVLCLVEFTHHIRVISDTDNPRALGENEEIAIT